MSLAILPELPDTSSILNISKGQLAELRAKQQLPASAAPRGKNLADYPAFLKQANQEYRSKNAHVFVLHGNVNDYPDNEAHLTNLRKLMVLAYDENYADELNKNEGISVGASGKREAADVKRICGQFVINEGFRFDSEVSGDLFRKMLSDEYKAEIDGKKLPPDFLSPLTFDSLRVTLSRWFDLTKKRVDFNRKARATSQTLKVEAELTAVLFDCDIFLPSGNISSLHQDRTSIGYMRNWALDRSIGTRNKIFIVTRTLAQIHESLRGGFSGISTILIPKPSLADRKAYAENYCGNLTKAAAHLAILGDNATLLNSNRRLLTSVKFAEGFDFDSLAIQSSGMSRNQIEKAFNEARTLNVAIDERSLRGVKQKCMEEEFDGIIEFYHPIHGFKQVGGHEEVKKYIMEEIAEPLRSGDPRTCVPGLLMVGPGGTGKTFLAKAAAAEAGVNFVELNLSKLMNKYVGGTEEQTDKMLEAVWAAAPCIAFIDEIEAALGGGRVTSGDSNTGGRLFSSMLTFLSDESRLGKIVVIAATNRPDLLDPVLIRAGRFGAVLPVLPPPREGDASIEGRANILQALTSKHKISFDKELVASVNPLDSQIGLGRLLMDTKNTWTGAEIEVVLKDARGLAIRAKRDKSVVTMADWNLAMDSIIPNTGKVADMADLALFYSNNTRYCPEVWQARLLDKGTLQGELLAKGYNV